MEVIKRNGQRERLDPNQVVRRLVDLVGPIGAGDAPYLTPLSLDVFGVERVALKTMSYIKPDIKTSVLDEIATEIILAERDNDPSWEFLAQRVVISALHKITPATFSANAERIAAERPRLWRKDVLEFIRRHADKLDTLIEPNRDYRLDHLAWIAIKNNYLTRRESTGQKTSEVLETPQYLFMRVAIFGHYRREEPLDVILAAIRRGYELLSHGAISHATPLFINAGYASGQFASCLIFGVADDTKEIMRAVANTAVLSKNCAGIGIHMHEIRASGSLIASSGNISDGICQQLPIYEATIRCFSQGNRKGSAKIWLEPWHADIVRVLLMRREFGREDQSRPSTLFYGLWIPDLFMRRFLSGESWSLFSPDEAPGLAGVFDGMMCCRRCGKSQNPDLVATLAAATQRIGAERLNQALAEIDRKLLGSDPAGEACRALPCQWRRRDWFSGLYRAYELLGLARSQIAPQKIVELINELKREAGMPDCMFKDHVNRCSAQQAHGTIRSGNLCSEIVQYSSACDYTICTLSSVSAMAVLRGGRPGFAAVLAEAEIFSLLDFQRVADAAEYLAEYLYYVATQADHVVEETKRAAESWPNIGIGLQGLATLFIALGIEYDGEVATKIDRRLYEAVAYGATVANCRLAGRHKPFAGWENSPAAAGFLQQDLWSENQSRCGNSVECGEHFDWPALRREVSRLGLAMPNTTAQMPTVSSSVILGNTESFEALPMLIGTVGAVYGRHMKLAPFLGEALQFFGENRRDIIDAIIATEGMLTDETVAAVAPKIGPEFVAMLERVKRVFKTQWQIKPSVIIERSRQRAAWIDQAQSFNLFLTSNTDKILTHSFVAAWKAGLKTGSYYIRTKAASRPLSVPAAVCRRDANCESCSG